MSRMIDENAIIKMLNTMDRYTSEELTLCDTDKTFPKNEVFIVDDVFEGLDELPSAQPERKNDIIQKFHDYQIEWLKSHYDIELEPQLKEMIVRFLHDTANCYMMEVEHDNT